MKTLILWLADISGVRSQIRIDTIKEIGGRLYGDHYWWNGGIMYKDAKPDVMKAFKLYAEAMREGGYPDIMRVRDEVYKKEAVTP